MIEIYRAKLDENWQALLEIISSETEFAINCTQNMLCDVLSLQSHIERIEAGEVFIKNKKRRRGKLDIEKFKEKYFSDWKK